MRIGEIDFKAGMHPNINKDDLGDNLAVVTVSWRDMDETKQLLGHTWMNGETKYFENIVFNPNMLSMSPLQEITNGMLPDLFKLSHRMSTGMLYDYAQTYAYHSFLTVEDNITIAWQNANSEKNMYENEFNYSLYSKYYT